MNAEFVGGSDLVSEMYENGELKKLFLKYDLYPKEDVNYSFLLEIKGSRKLNFMFYLEFLIK